MKAMLEDLTVVFDKYADAPSIKLGRRNHINNELCQSPKPVDITTDALKAVACLCSAADNLFLLDGGKKYRLAFEEVEE